MADMLRPAARTKSRLEVMEHAAHAMRNFSELEVVRFIIPEPVQWHRPLDDYDLAPKEWTSPVCSMGRERGFVVWTGGQRVRLVVRFHDARNDDVFYEDETGGLWEFAT